LILIKVVLGRRYDAFTAVIEGHSSRSEADQSVHKRNLIAIVGELARELHPQHAKPQAISLSSRLERDLGIDSLGRTEFRCLR
jgi:hypothetical protein